MTLTKAIEAARDLKRHLESALHIYSRHGTRVPPTFGISALFEAWDEIYKYMESLSALPDKPMTEMDVKKLIAGELFGTIMFKAEIANKVFDALKAANVLYVEEK